MECIICCTDVSCNWLISINLTATIDSVLRNIELIKTWKTNLHLRTSYGLWGCGGVAPHSFYFVIICYEWPTSCPTAVPGGQIG
jgi:hypothetical protein